MQHLAFRVLRLSVAAALLLCGCNSGMFDWLPFEPKERTSHLTPPKRIAHLHALADAARSKSPAEQQQVSQDLAQEIAQEDDPLMRQEILRTLSRYPTSTSKDVLLAGLKDSNPDVRAVACRMAGELEGPDVALLLGELLQSDTDLDVRLAAARALERFKHPEAVPALAIALDDPNPALQIRAAQSLKGVTGKDFGHDIVAWRQYVRGETPQPQPTSIADRLRKWNPF